MTSESLKILYHHRTRGDGAEGVHINEMIQAFCQLGHEVTLCCPKQARNIPGLHQGMTGTSSKRGIGFFGAIRIRVRQALEIFYNIIAMAKLYKVLAGGGYNVVYERYSPYSFAGVLMCKHFEIPLWLEVNSTYCGRFRRRKLGFPKLASKIENYVLQESNTIAVVSSPLERCVRDRVGSNHRVVVTPNAINEVAWNQPIDPAEIYSLRSTLNIGESDFVIGFVGSLRTWHGVDMLLHCIPRLSEAIQDAKFLIVGSGELEQELFALSNSSDWGDRVIATGGVSHHEVPKYLSLMSVGLMPHSNEWGSPMKILEYMAMSVAVVAPRLEPIEEIVQHERTGILFEPRNEHLFCNAIEMLAKDRDFAKQLSKNAREFVFSQRTWKDNAKCVIGSSHPIESVQ